MARRRSKATAAVGELAAVKADTEELRAEVRRLRVQLESITNQRDLLKRPAGFCGQIRECFALIEAMDETYHSA